MRAWMVVTTFVLAGCASNAAGPSLSGLDAQLQDVDAQAGNGLGCIRGVVVDEAIRPIANATVRLTPGNRTLQADASGIFTVCDLEPGTYFLAASAKGHLPAQSSTEVAADEVRNLRIGLLVDPLPTPFHETFKFEGFIQASASIASFAVDLVADTFLGVSTCTCTYEFTTAPTVVAITQEAIWTDSVPRVAQGSTKYRELYPTFHDGNIGSIQSAFEGSPMLATFDRAKTWGGDEGTFLARITGDGYWVDYEQRYTMYITLWHHAQPPEGWSFIQQSG